MNGKVRPCGYDITNVKVADRNKHFKTCPDAACQKSWGLWLAFVEAFKKPGAFEYKVVAK